MPLPIEQFSDEQARTIINLEQRYQVWMQTEQRLSQIPYDLRRKSVGGRDYLYEITDRGGNGKSLGRMKVEQQRAFTDYRAEKEDAKTRGAKSATALQESGRLYRTLRLPLIASAAGKILREIDRRQLMGSHLIVVGTNALPAYALEAGGFIRDAPDETDDFDMAWTADCRVDDDIVWSVLKSVDSTFAVNTERNFQARNADAYEFELLAAPSKMQTMSVRDKPRPIALPEQEWLLKGRRVDHIVVCRDASPARIVAPDPRWFGLHKLWMSVQPKRNPLKRPKDAKQGMALLNTVDQAMPLHPLDTEFETELPPELKPFYEHWQQQRPERSTPLW
jgi:hypothetical protein